MESAYQYDAENTTQEFVMSDYERYGDYNETEDDIPKSKSPVLLILKIVTAVICIGVIGILAFRMFTFANYPNSVKKVYFNDKLTEHYNANGGNITVKTQALRAPYDDKDLGNFFCDYLYLIEDIEQLQITLRYNKSTVERLSKELGVELDDMNPDLFTFELVACEGLIDESGEDVESNWLLKRYSTVTTGAFDSQLMYRYHKLVFDSVSYDTESYNESEPHLPYWIRLDIKIKGYEDKVYSVPIYENNVTLHDFTEYKLGKDEKPE